MKEVPDYEKYPVSEEEMGRRYKQWAEWLAGQMIIFYDVGKEVGGEKFVQRLTEEYYKFGRKGAKMWPAVTGTKPEDYTNCQALLKLQDFIDDSFGNFWNGHVENSPQAFEKELYTCPMARQFSKKPEICEILISETMKGMFEAMNPKFDFKGFSKLLTKGDKVCRFRVELKE
ncbi:MAG: hypothetical protein AB2L12_08325 [Smithellaceae bacterium]